MDRKRKGVKKLTSCWSVLGGRTQKDKKVSRHVVTLKEKSLLIYWFLCFKKRRPKIFVNQKEGAKKKETKDFREG